MSTSTSNQEAVITSLSALRTELQSLRGDIQKFFTVRAERRKTLRLAHAAVLQSCRPQEPGLHSAASSASPMDDKSELKVEGTVDKWLKASGDSLVDTVKNAGFEDALSKDPAEEEVVNPTAAAVSAVLEKIKGGIVRSGKAPEKVIFTGKMMEADMKNFLKAHDPSLSDEACKLAWDQMDKERKDRITPIEFLITLGLAADPKKPKGDTPKAGEGGDNDTSRRDSVCPILTGEKVSAPDHLARMIHKTADQSTSLPASPSNPNLAGLSKTYEKD